MAPGPCPMGGGMLQLHGTAGIRRGGVVLKSSEQDVLAERAAIDAEVEGKTVCHLLERNATSYAAHPALSWEEGDRWSSMTWHQYRERVAAVTVALKGLGVQRGDFVAIMARNRPEHVVADLGIVHAGATPVSLYNTLAPEQIAYIAGHCGAKIAVLEDREFLERWEKVKPELPALERVILLDGEAEDDWVLPWKELVARGEQALAAPAGREAFEESWRRVRPDDLATLIYTSGTTGPPKAVMITHRNAVWTALSLDRNLAYPTGLRAVSYLPLAHVAERLLTHYLAMHKVAHVHYCPEVLRVFEVMPRVRPQAFFGVPRVWEKLQAGILARLAAETDARKRKIGRRALEVGRRAAALKTERKAIPVGLRVQRALFEKLVYSRVRHALGLDQCILAGTAAAPISLDTLHFFEGIGLPLVEG
ncbi:MAG: hypothetical protein E6G44_02140 [Actinobacteria bacterium]|nr:MAG: hypothetical protein E6G44_02140 [Actinomycetota bacterium]